MYTLIIFLALIFSNSVSANKCSQFQKVSEYLNTKNFVKASREHRALRREPELHLGDVNQARTLAMRFPAFEDLGFGHPGSPNWTPYTGRLEKSGLHGKVVGMEVRNDKGHARVRIDWDEKKGAHYNIEITEKGKSDTHKLAITFNCGQLPCTEKQVMKMVERMQ